MLRDEGDGTCATAERYDVDACEQRDLRFYNILVCSVRAAERQAASGAPRDWSVLGVEGGALAGGVLRARGRSTPR